MTTIISVLVTLLGVVLAAFGLGRRSGKKTANQDAAAERAAALAEESEKQIEVLKNAVDVQQDVNSQPDSAVSERLRERWRREGD